MLKVKNEEVVNDIAKTTYKANKKRNLLTIFAVFLTTFLIAVIFAVGISYWNIVTERNIRIQGMKYDIELPEPRDDQIEKIKGMDNVKYAGLLVKCAIVEKYKDILLDKTRLYWADETCFKNQAVPAMEYCKGSYPQKENEIMLSFKTLKDMGIEEPEIGMKLPISYFTLAQDSDEDIIEKEFVLCGWYLEYSGNNRGYVSKDFYKATGVKPTDLTQGSLKITLKSPLFFEKDLIKMQKEIGIDSNQLIEGDTDIIINFLKMAAGLIFMLVMVFASGYLFIYNIFYISVTKDIRYYGQLKTVGMTSVQLKRMVYKQAVWNSLAGIPAGLVLAFVVIKTIVVRILIIVSLGNIEMSANNIIDLKLWIFILAGGFAFLTSIISCKKPADIVGECSPVEAMRYIGILKNIKKHKVGNGSLYSMAFRNMFRDKKQAVVIFISFTISVSIFLVVNVVIRANDSKHILNEISNCDMDILNETTLDDDREQILTDEKISGIEKLTGVESVRKVTSAEAVVPYDEDVYGDYYRELYKTRYYAGQSYEDDIKLYKQNPAHGFFAPRFIGIDDYGFEMLNENLGNVLDKRSFEKGEIAVAIKFFTEGDSGMTGKTAHFYLPEGLEPEKEYSIKIAAVGDVWMNPAHFAGGSTPDLVVSEKYAKQLLGETFTERICINYKEPYSEQTEGGVKSIFSGEKRISIDSKLESYNLMKGSEIQIKILGGSIGLIMAVLALLNYLNMMAAGVQNRSREFATLESIGMTTKQIKKMLRLEGIGYAVISVIASMVIGLPLSYIVFTNMVRYLIKFSIPWINNLFLFTVIIVLCMAAPVIIYKRTQDTNIIERLNYNEN